MNTVDEYINYLSTINHFKDLPLWKRQLYSYEQLPHKSITLPDINCGKQLLEHIQGLTVTKQKSVYK